MRLDFTKMNGAGNDFVMLDNRSGKINLTEHHIVRLTNRHRGIGADGLILVEQSQLRSYANSEQKPQYRMRYYNADGREVEMCGNGARCFTHFLYQIQNQRQQDQQDLPSTISFETVAGTITGTYLPTTTSDTSNKEASTGSVQLQMSTPHSLQMNIGIEQLLSETASDKEKKKLLDETTLIPLPLFHQINTGVPHLVCFVPDLDKVNLSALGPLLRYHPHFNPPGININLVEILTHKHEEDAPSHLAIRTYERGVESETLACGTGVVAAALIYHLLHQVPSPVTVKVQSGNLLKVDFQESSSNNQLADFKPTLTGPTEIVFEGNVLI